jgi:signal peptidase I
MRKLLKSLQIIVVVLLFGTAAFFAALSLPVSGWKLLSVQTGSMEPNISTGSLVFVHNVPLETLDKGDVITYKSKNKVGKTVTHRVVEKKGNQNGPKQFITKGDANPTVDMPVSQHDVVGKVDYYVPFLGEVLDFIRSPAGLLIAIYLPALLVVWQEIKRLAAYYKTMLPYVAAGVNPHLQQSMNAKVTAKVILVVIGLVAGVVALPVRALLQDSANLTSNTISAVIPSHLLIYSVNFTSKVCEPPAFSSLISNTGANSVNILNSKNVCKVKENNNTNINVGNQNNQTSTSGDTSGSNATSGNASNNSSTNINIDIRNNSTLQRQKVIVYNPTSSPVNLSGWKLSDNSNTQNVGAGNLAPGNFRLVNWNVAGGLNVTGDRMILKNPSSLVLDAVSWGSDATQLNPSVLTNPSTTSIFRINPTIDTNFASDWAATP